jgi:hypothetical protein
MYGLVNKAIREMMLARTSHQVWCATLESAGIDEDAFVISESYADEITFSLTKAASQTLNISVDQFLRDLGHWWIRQTAVRDYPHLMHAAGTSLKDFLLRLPDLHTRIGIIFPRLQPPEFACSDIGPVSLRLHYRSHRQGLVPFLIGLLEALALHFKTPLRITHETREGASTGHEIFLLEWTETPNASP